VISVWHGKSKDEDDCIELAKARVFAGKEENEKGGKAKMLGINSVQSARMKSEFKLAIIISSFLALLYACGAERSTPPGEISVTLTPSTASVHVTQSVQLTATVHNSTNGAVTWSLSGAGCSGITCGTISDNGLYTAPASVPSPATVTVKATSVADISKSDSATITILEAVTNEWTWVSGANTVDQPGIYGTKGTADPSNVPGARCGAASWLDSSGKLWLFGGENPYYYYLNDLWKYDPTTFEWTWVSGDNTVNQAGIYGTKGTADPSNVPGARIMAVSWLDSSGKLWLFGGWIYDSLSNSGCFNDLWKYDPTTLEWTWVSGANTVDQAGIYGTKGTADPSNVPGGRYGAASWLDSSGKLWLFGGGGIGSVDEDRPYDLNDLWKYDPITLEWTWVSGANTVDQAGIYGTKGTADPSNVPGARRGAASWIDSQGKLWLFGGVARDSGGNRGYINDLWKYIR
jgi:N-acetylneuraminic acid mutarotase